jgi:(E)-4-hydroxy-3-methylbut-2-enyl-diphosphate synthase
MHETDRKNIARRQTRAVRLGNIFIGAGHPVTVQSMTKTKTEDVDSTVKEILELEKAGCEIIRCSANSTEAADALKKIRQKINIPLVADIHFDHQLALKAVEAGVSKIRINPGNIGSKDKIREVVDACSANGISIRIGVNSGSLEKDILKQFGSPVPEALVESAMRHIGILEELNFHEIIISLKSSSVNDTIKSYRMLSEKVNYPLHLGVTEAGTSYQGIIKSSIGIGSLLADGIGDTIRVSLTDTGLEEIKVGWEILKSLGIRNHGIEIISCPTCGRLENDLMGLVARIEKELGDITDPIKIAVMGCVVNGPGEAKEADIGLTLGKENCILYVDGRSQGMIPYSEAALAIIREARKKSIENKT